MPHSYPSHLLEQARRVIHRYAQDSYSWCGSRWLVLLAVVDPLKIETDRQELLAAVQRFLDMLNADRAAPASAGVGCYYAGWPALPRSFADAQFALELGSQIHGPGRVFLPKDLGLASFVCHADAALKTELAERLLQPLLDKADLLATLETFLNANLSSSQAARTLRIHRHTLDYRLNKIAQLTGLDPRHFDAAAQLLAALLWLGTENSI
jgi:sugar diacid utilization regulator